MGAWHRILIPPWTVSLAFLTAHSPPWARQGRGSRPPAELPCFNIMLAGPAHTFS